MENIKIVEGYRKIYRPEFKYSQDDGWISEHRYFMIVNIKRNLTDGEIVHHLDGNRLNNRMSNLLLMSQKEHIKLHTWINDGCQYFSEIPTNMPKLCYSPVFCKTCGLTLQNAQKQYCSHKCKHNSSYYNNIPTKKAIYHDIKTMKYIDISNKYAIPYKTIYNLVRKYKIRWYYNAVHKHVTKLYKNDILNFLELGLTYGNIAAKYGVTNSYISKYVDKHNLYINGKYTMKNRQRPSKQELQELLNENSYTDIGEMYNVTRIAVIKWTNKFDIIKNNHGIDDNTITYLNMHKEFNISHVEFAKWFGVSKQYMAKWLKNDGTCIHRKKIDNRLSSLSHLMDKMEPEHYQCIFKIAFSPIYGNPDFGSDIINGECGDILIAWYYELFDKFESYRRITNKHNKE